jgi:hypothetical protein
MVAAVVDVDNDTDDDDEEEEEGAVLSPLPAIAQSL